MPTQPLWLARRREAERQAALVARLAREAAPEQTVTDSRYKQPAGGDLTRLRGIPAIGRGVSGAIPGTKP